MFSKAFTAAIVLLLCASAARAEWTVLRAADGSVVEIAVDFQIKSKQLTIDREAYLIVKTQAHAEEMGFALKLSNWKEKTDDVEGKKTQVPWMLCDVEIRSMGLPTRRLEDRLRKEFGDTDRIEPASTIVAPYHGYSIGLVAPQPTIIQATGAGLCYDESGKLISAENFGIRMILDFPMQILRVYFSVPGGFYGSGSHADRAREQWFKSNIQPKR